MVADGASGGGLPGSSVFSPYYGYNTEPSGGTYDSDPNSDGGNSSTSTPNPPVGTPDDYTGWNWEQTLNGVLGLALPARTEVTTGRWTVVQGKSNSSLYLIYDMGFFGAGGGGGSAYVYLNPAL